jgi:23S rRNA pseudouridine2605 synthase
MRLNQYLAACGLGSRRKCEELISSGVVEVNGRPVEGLATRIGEGDVVKVRGVRVSPAESITLLLNKPEGFVCSRSDERGRKTIYDLIPARYHSLHHVGRLDRDSSGLILLTNDGNLSHALTHPGHQVEKEYVVTADQAIRETHFPVWLRGLQTSEGFARADRVQSLSNRKVRMVLSTGLKRQIRHMFKELGYQVVSLNRTRIGKLHLRDLPVGAWRQLRRVEVEELRRGSAAPSAPGATTRGK